MFREPRAGRRVGWDFDDVMTIYFFLLIYREHLYERFSEHYCHAKMVEEEFRIQLNWSRPQNMKQLT